MKIKYVYVVLFFTALILSCTTKPTINKDSVSNIFEDQDSKDSWISNTTDEQNELLKELAESDQLISTRQKVIMDDSKRDTIPDPAMPENMVAGIEIRLNQDLTNYNGSFKVESRTERKISGRLNDETLANIFYKLPSNESLPRVNEELTYQLTYNEEFNSGSMNRNILVHDDGSPLLLLVEEGSSKPYIKRFEGINLSVQQIAGEKEDFSSVRIEFQRQSLVLQLGERKRVKSNNGNVEFFLKSTYASKYSLMDEGLPYFVKLYAYRVD